MGVEGFQCRTGRVEFPSEPVQQIADSSNFSITGFLSGGGTVSFNVVGADLFAPVVLNWTSLSKVEFAYGSGDFGAIDNLNVTPNAVPEPATLVLLGSGLLGIARRAGRRSRP